MVEGIAFLTVSGPQQGGDRCRVRCDFAKIVEAVHGSLVCAAGAVASGSPREQCSWSKCPLIAPLVHEKEGHTNLSHFDLTFWGKHLLFSH